MGSTPRAQEIKRPVLLSLAWNTRWVITVASVPRGRCSASTSANLTSEGPITATSDGDKMQLVSETEAACCLAAGLTAKAESLCNFL